MLMIEGYAYGTDPPAPQTSKEDRQQQLSSPGKGESSTAGTANVLRNALLECHHRCTDELETRCLRQGPGMCHDGNPKRLREETNPGSCDSS